MMTRAAHAAAAAAAAEARRRPPTEEQLRRRRDRAVRLWLDHGDEFAWTRRYDVRAPSQTYEDRRYTVRLDRQEHVVSGTCPDWRFRHPRGGCKHMIAVQNYFLRGRGARQARQRRQAERALRL